MDELNLILAANIASLRQAAGMTQAELGEQLNYSDKLISKWERGDAAPNAYTLKQLSEVFGVTVDYLFADHRGGGEVVYSLQKTERKKFSNRTLVAGISVCGMWLLAMLIYVILSATLENPPGSELFVYALPAALILILVLNSVWNRGKHNFIIIGVLLVSIAMTVYVALLRFHIWQIFLLLIPAELIVLLCAMLKKR